MGIMLGKIIRRVLVHDDEVAVLQVVFRRRSVDWIIEEKNDKYGDHQHNRRLPPAQPPAKRRDPDQDQQRISRQLVPRQHRSSEKRERNYVGEYDDCDAVLR